MLGVSLGLWIVIALLTIITFLLFLISAVLTQVSNNLRTINNKITDIKIKISEISFSNVSNTLYGLVKNIEQDVQEIRRDRLSIYK